MLSLATVLNRPMSARIPKVFCHVVPANGDPVRVLSTWSQKSMYPRDALPSASSSWLMMPDGGAVASAATVPAPRPVASPSAAACAAIPASLVVLGGSVKGARRVAAADALA